LIKNIEGTRIKFATRTCRDCDGRYSCPSYREYAVQSGAKTLADFKRYYEDFRDEADQETFITANIDTAKLDEIIAGQGSR